MICLLRRKVRNKLIKSKKILTNCFKIIDLVIITNYLNHCMIKNVTVTVIFRFNSTYIWKKFRNGLLYKIQGK